MLYVSRLDVNKDRRRTEPRDRRHRRKKAVRRRNDLVARTDIACHQTEQYRVTPGCAADRVFDTAVLGEFLL